MLRIAFVLMLNGFLLDISKGGMGRRIDIVRVYVEKRRGSPSVRKSEKKRGSLVILYTPLDIF